MNSSNRPAIDLRPLVTAPLIDQGARPLCVPISLSLAHEAAVITAADQARAPEAIWWHCTKEGLVSADGMLLEDAGDTLEVSGQPALVAWPWNPNLGVGTEDPPGAAGSPPWQTATLEPLDLAHDGIESDIEDALAEGRPVVLVVEVTDEFDEAGEDGSIEVPDIRSASGDYHAVLVVGAATDAERGRRLLIRNSWGDYWGAGGYAWLPLDYLIAFAAEAAVVINWHAAL